MNQPEPGALLTPSEVAHLFRVDPKTVTRWAKSGRLPSIRTLGGHRRFPAEAVYAAFAQGDTERGPEPDKTHEMS